MNRRYNILTMILMLGISIMFTSCYGCRKVGLWKERDELPEGESVAHEP